MAISVSFAPGTDEAVSAVQFDVEYESSAMSLIATPGLATRNSYKSLYYKDLSPNVRRFILVGANQETIPAGSVIDFFVNLVPRIGLGVYALKISQPTTVDASGSAVLTTGKSGAVHVELVGGAPISPGSVLSAASLIPGAVAAGELITLIGSDIGPTIGAQPVPSPVIRKLRGAKVFFDGNEAPLLYASANQVNVIVPFEVAGKDVTNMRIESGDKVIVGFPLAVAPSAPGIFTRSGNGVGPGTILNQDLSPNSPSNAADRGSVVILFATGAGSMTPIPQDGAVMGDTISYPDLHVSVQIGGIDSDVVFAGSARGLVAGVLQVNCRVPQNVPPGDSVSVNLNVGTTSSPNGVVISVR